MTAEEEEEESAVKANCEQDREAKVQALRAAIEEGLASGPAEAFDGQEFLAEMARRHHL